jgi:hypothetical protein
MKYADRLSLPPELRPGRRFDMKAANARHKWLRTGKLDEWGANNRAARRARRPRIAKPPPFESQAQCDQHFAVLSREQLRNEARAERKAGVGT